MTTSVFRPLVLGFLAVTVILLASAVGNRRVVAQGSATGLPVGTVVPFAGAVAPQGFLMADGQPLDAQTYSELCGVIRDRYKLPNDPLGTCRLPDLKGRFVLGAAGTRRPMGDSGGRDSVQLSAAQMPSHGHTLNGLKGQIAYQRKDGDPIGRVEVNAAMRPDGWGVPFTELTKTLSTDSAGGGEVIDLMPPFVTLNYIIKINN